MPGPEAGVRVVRAGPRRSVRELMWRQRHSEGSTTTGPVRFCGEVREVWGNVGVAAAAAPQRRVYRDGALQAVRGRGMKVGRVWVLLLRQRHSAGSTATGPLRLCGAEG